jgi:hypothetical protein
MGLQVMTAQMLLLPEATGFAVLLPLQDGESTMPVS